MAALGELIIFFIYFLLGLSAIVFLLLTFTTKKSLRPWTLISSIFFCFLFFSFKSCRKEGYNKDQLDQVGLYYLNNYPNYDNCILELKEDMTYEVTSRGKVLEKSNWHYESGGDYWITYLDNDKQQLGAGEYSYEHYKLKSRGNK